MFNFCDSFGLFKGLERLEYLVITSKKRSLFLIGRSRSHDFFADTAKMTSLVTLITWLFRGHGKMNLIGWKKTGPFQNILFAARQENQFCICGDFLPDRRFLRYFLLIKPHFGYIVTYICTVKLVKSMIFANLLTMITNIAHLLVGDFW